jgi:pimeloyl-ACP methyl ester carboxylesterase
MQGAGLGFGADPMDMATNLRLMAGTADDGTTLVERALKQAGVGPGEPVLLAGHSQGGMVAMALAGSAAFTARYSVAAVLTAGSPTATFAADPAIPVLHLEHRQDLVPALDGRPAPVGRNRTSATRDLTASSDPADRLAGHDPGAAHQIDTYVRTAEAVSATGAPSVRDWEAAAQRVLGGPGTQAVRLEFTGTRLATVRLDASRGSP